MKREGGDGRPMCHVKSLLGDQVVDPPSAIIQHTLPDSQIYGFQMYSIAWDGSPLPIQKLERSDVHPTDSRPWLVREPPKNPNAPRVICLAVNGVLSQWWGRIRPRAGQRRSMWA